MEADGRCYLPTEVDDVLRGPDEFEHFVVPSGLKPPGLELVTQLRALLVLGFIIKSVLQFDDELNGLAQSVHDQLLVAEGLDPGYPELLLLLKQFRVQILLFPLEALLLDLVDLLLAAVGEDVGEESLLARLSRA